MNKMVTFDNNALTLVGRKINVNQRGPDFIAKNQEMEDITLSSFNDKIKLINSFTSVDTPVCDIQVREFNKQASKFPDFIEVIGISKDLPFAQKRFCETFDIKNMTIISDYNYLSFGINYGVLIKEWNLLSRGVVILDKNNTVRYFQLVSEIMNQPDYDEAFKQLENVINDPEVLPNDNGPYKCIPCEDGVPPLPNDVVNTMAIQYPNWELVEGKKIVRQLKFKNFVEAKYFLDLLSIITEEQGHHPSFNLNYNRLKVTLTTHASGGLTDNDFLMARLINEVTE